ncbi:LrgB family protein [Membranihabitans maritimus]|uniref:LrgB family protein n=1 Tax=Membranihabitans maritimus TaxID=2904244 RepID=UPI001F27DE17|nr:LrgB family protein [Membranihabitans maritimus]
MGWLMLVTILLFWLGNKLYKELPILLFVPVFFAVSGSILFLWIFDFTFDQYFKENEAITFFLGPSVVALGVLLFKQVRNVKKNLTPLVLSIGGGTLISVFSVMVFTLVFQLPDDLSASLVPISITTPVAIDVAKGLGGDPGITSVVVIAIGIFGNMCAPWILHKLGIIESEELGVGIGTGSHGIGTARAIRIHEKAGLYSGLAMAINAVITVFLAPIIWGLFH